MAKILSEVYFVKAIYELWMLEEPFVTGSAREAWDQAYVSIVKTERLTRGRWKKRPLIGAKVRILDKSHTVIADWELIAPKTWVRHHKSDALGHERPVSQSQPSEENLVARTPGGATSSSESAPASSEDEHRP